MTCSNEHRCNHIHNSHGIDRCQEERMPGMLYCSGHRNEQNHPEYSQTDVDRITESIAVADELRSLGVTAEPALWGINLSSDEAARLARHLRNVRDNWGVQWTSS